MLVAISFALLDPSSDAKLYLRIAIPASYHLVANEQLPGLQTPCQSNQQQGSVKRREAQTRICTAKPKTIRKHNIGLYLLCGICNVVAIETLVQGLEVDGWRERILESTLEMEVLGSWSTKDVPHGEREY